MSYRRCRRRHPWFDRLTVLSKVEGLTTLSEVEEVSRKPSSTLDSPPQADFTTSGMTKSGHLVRVKGASSACDKSGTDGNDISNRNQRLLLQEMAPPKTFVLFVFFVVRLLASSLAMSLPLLLQQFADQVSSFQPQPS